MTLEQLVRIAKELMKENPACAKAEIRFQQRLKKHEKVEHDEDGTVVCRGLIHHYHPYQQIVLLPKIKETK